MNCWVLVYPRRLQGMAKDLVAAMESTCGPIGMRISRPSVVELQDDRIETYSKNIRGVLGREVRRGSTAWKSCGAAGSSGILVLCFLAGERAAAAVPDLGQPGGFVRHHQEAVLHAIPGALPGRQGARREGGRRRGEAVGVSSLAFPCRR